MPPNLNELPGVSVGAFDPPKYIKCPHCKYKLAWFRLITSSGKEIIMECKNCGEKFKVKFR